MQMNLRSNGNKVVQALAFLKGVLPKLYSIQLDVILLSNATFPIYLTNLSTQFSGRPGANRLLMH